MGSINSHFKKEVFEPYVGLLKAQYRFHPVFSNAKKVWEGKLNFDALVNGPYLERAQLYAEGDALESLPLHEGTIKTIKDSVRFLWKH